MRAKLVNEAIKHLSPKPKEEIEAEVIEEVKEKLKYLEKVTSKPIEYNFKKLNFKSEMFGSSNFLQSYVKDIEKELNSKLDRGKVKMTRDWNVGDYWIVSFLKDKDHPIDKYGDYCQLGFTLEMEDWEPKDRLKACGFGAATGDGDEIFLGLTLDQFAQKLNDYYKTGKLTKK